MRSTGLRPGDLIIQINRERISTAEQVTEIFNRYMGRRSPVRVWIERDGSERYSDFYIGR